MICVLGATGNVGRELVDGLCSLGERVRVVTREESKASRWGGRVEAVVGDLHDSGTRACALAGISRLFCFPFVDEPALHDAIVGDAKRAAVRHVVALSSIGATAPTPIGRRHREREQAIERAGLAWTFLRPSYFTSNALRWAPAIRAEGRVVTPIPDGKADCISPHDIADVAKIALTQPGHEGMAYALTGTELLSVREQVAILSRVVGKPIACVRISIEDAADGLRKLGRPEWLVESLVAMWRSVAAGPGEGHGDLRTDTFTRLTGRPPERFETWAAAHREAFC